jgi:hypothetical protein
MSLLDKLQEAKAKEQILLAEIATLLHNVGKLDPNFLALMVSDTGEAQAKVKEHHLHIENYSYRRFAAPDSRLLADDVQAILQQASPDKVETGLRSYFSSVVRDLPINTSNYDSISPHETNPFMVGAVKAVRQFHSWSKGNGPLYICLKRERSSRQQAVEKERKGKDDTKPKSSFIYDQERNFQKELEDEFRNINLSIVDETWSLADLLTLFWDRPFFFKPKNDLEADYKRKSTLQPWFKEHVGTGLTALLILAHGEISGAEKPYSLPKKESNWEALRKATAFGYEHEPLQVWDLADKRDLLIRAALTACRSPISQRASFIEAARSALEAGLGDTQWPVNEINLWDYATTIATLFKSAVAKAVMEDKIPDVGEMKWRLLSIRYDGLGYLSRAHRISDLLARRDILREALDAVQAVVEVEIPLGNQIYRDENGSVLVVPHVTVENEEIDVLKLPPGEGADTETLDRLLVRRFAETGRSPLGGELAPIIALSGSVRGKDIRLTEAPAWANPPLHADAAAIAGLWEDKTRHGEVCTVCELRPQGYGAPENDWNWHVEKGHRPGELPLDCKVCKAQSRAICHICLERRDDRSKEWATNEIAFSGTIWTDEVADADGRLALIVGRFGLEGWLDGQLIPTMQKSVSFARIRRCWSTTRSFWQEVEAELPMRVGGHHRARLLITPDQPSSLTNLGLFHAYEIKINGRYLSVVWDPEQKRFITTENLDYVRKLLGVRSWIDSLKEKSFTVYEPSAHLTQRESRISINIEKVEEVSNAYSPAITLLTEPAVYMALVPADKALGVAQFITEKYEREMSKVRDRLPLHLGLVFAPRRTPIRTILEAGGRILNMPNGWESWHVCHASSSKNEHSAVDEYRTITFANGVAWQMPLTVGDLSNSKSGAPDNWYPHILRHEPAPEEDLSATRFWAHAREINEGDAVYVRPSLFDFEFLDTNVRRIEISYDETGRRRHYSNRPFFLEELEHIDDLWQALVGGERKLSITQLENLEGMLLGRITEWHGGSIAQASEDEAYRQFALAVLHRLDKSWWRAINQEQRGMLEQWVQKGKLLDLLDLMMHILKEPKAELMAEGEE